MERTIDVRDLQVRYRVKRGAVVGAVRGIDFEVRTGEVVGILGPARSGKSSIVNALMGFVTPSAGECLVFGEPPGSPGAKRRIGYLPEVAVYPPYLTPQETLTMYGELQGLKGVELQAQATELLETVGLSMAMKKQNRTLTKGMMQRLGIAQALLGNPDLLILDALTSGLNSVGRRELRTLLKARQRRGCKILFTSHELGDVDMLCDRILLIHQGRLIEERRIEELRASLRHYTVVFSGHATMIGLTENWRHMSNGNYEARFSTKPHLIQALERIHRAGAQVLDLVVQEGSLEEYFVDTIGRAA